MFELHENEWCSCRDNLNFNDYFTGKKIRTNKQITYYNDVLAFDIEATSFDEDIDIDLSDTEVYEYLTGTTIRVSQQTYDDIPDFNDIRKSLFGRLYFSKSSGIRIDSLYQNLNNRYPWIFPDDVINQSDQLEVIITAYMEHSPVKEDHDIHRALMYVWQLAINGRVIIGRTWDEFVELLNQISTEFNLDPKKRMIIFVHNLSYEFEYIKDLFEWEKVFAIATRKPIFALTKTGIEFRCSYILSKLSLENVGDSLTKYKVKKLVGSLDYDKPRHFMTPLQEDELQYCINDVLVVSGYIKELMEKEDNDITRLPLTATGYCRNFVRHNCLVGNNKEEQYNRYHEMISHLTISGAAEYDLMSRAFMGGFTHCSTRYSLKTLPNVDSFDFTSAYPYVLVSEPEFPMSKGKKVNITSYEELKKYCKLYFCIFDIKFIGLKPKYINENYIPVSKCFMNDYKPVSKEYKKKHGFVANNGRLVGTDPEGETNITITSIDMQIIDLLYTWSQIGIGQCYIYKKGYLPKEIVSSIIELYKAKTTLKGVKGQEDFYTKSKQLLNSIYGMMVTSILMPIHSYDTDWTIEKKDEEKEIKSYNKSKKRFLFYPWGIATTALCRKNLWSGILAFGDDYIYSDTDSLKVLNADKHMDYINGYNNMVERKLKKAAAYYDIPFEDFKPKTIKGVEKMLGVWDKETERPWKLFRSIGAKRYMILTDDDELTITVSGVNKNDAVPYLLQKYGRKKAFEYFDNDLTIPAEYFNKQEQKWKSGTGKLTHYYLDYPMGGDITDYLGNTVKYYSPSGVYMEKASYNFSMEEAYIEYLRELRGEQF